MSKPLVIVESPAKARTISKFLGKNFLVEASIGHVRDLPESASAIPESHKKLKWARTGVDVDNDFAPLYVLTDRGREQVRKLKALLKEATEVFLATDEDREGEAIAWHLLEVLRPKVPVRRLVFHEITKKAIEGALASPRELAIDLVRAQETRRIVDRLYGYTVSPVLWRKVRPKLSAGRVQSLAVRLVVEREWSRIRFVSSSWWDLSSQFSSAKGSFCGRVLTVDGVKVASGRDFDPDTGQILADRAVVVLDEPGAQELVQVLRGAQGRVATAERREFKERPAPPFITSTLQQEANRKFRWAARRTMSAAQKLYENGWITYMRTDSTSLSDEAIRAVRALVQDKFGRQYLPPEPRQYRTNSKGAQEAHEAIRPAGEVFRSLEEAQRELGGDEARLYELIWKRTVACQMEDARGVRMTVDVELEGGGRKASFRATGRAYTFAGFRQAYVEDSDTADADGDDRDGLLPDLRVGDSARAESLEAQGHTTQPPARLTDATLVKELEARGIGRPSTYASIIDTIETRGYVFKKGTALVPTWTAFAVTNLMERHFSQLVDYDFTATLEDGLDTIATGGKSPLEYLREFYFGTGEQGLVQLVDKAQADADPREICAIPVGTIDGEPLVARVGRYGPYIEMGGQTKSLPEDLPPDELSPERAREILAAAAEGPRVLGVDPITGLQVTAHQGRFGPYVQLGEQEEGSKAKPKRESLLRGMEVESLDLQTALSLLELPRNLGKDDSGNDIFAHNGRFGPYIKAGDETRSLPPTVSPIDVTYEQAIELLKQPRRRGGVAGTPAVMQELGAGGDGKAITVRQGRFGPYVTDGEYNATIPKGADPAAMTLEAAIALLEPKRAAGPPKGKAKSKASASKSTAAKSTAAKSTAAKSTAAKTVSSKAPAAKSKSAKTSTAKSVGIKRG